MTEIEALVPMPGTRSVAVAAELRRLILSGELPPGTRLRQARLAKSFGVSITPVREALATIAREGLIQQDEHRGAVVYLPTLADLRENLEIRLVLEPLATELAAPRLTEEQLDELADIAQRMEEETDPDRYQELNRSFHSLIYRSAGRRKLLDIIDGLRDTASVTVRTQASLATLRADHRVIVDALRARDARRAGWVMAEHIRHTAERLESILTTILPAAPPSADGET